MTGAMDLKSRSGESGDSRIRRGARQLAVHAAVRWLRWASPSRATIAQGAAEDLAVIGFMESASGLGAAARGLVDALARWPARAFCIAPLAPTPQVAGDSAATPLHAAHGRAIDVGVHVYNPDIFLALVRRYGGRFLLGRRFNLSVVNWETERLPATWPEVLSLYDGLAAPSAFTAAAVRRATGRTVHVLPNCVVPMPPRVRPRAARRFEVLCLFDHHSDVDRKNPLGAIRAFRRACAGLPSGVTARLRVKCHANTPAALADRLRAEAPDCCVEILRATLPPEQIHELWEDTDCLVSLHRSEGFGLPVAEALARGIPVVATRQGGILDFTDDTGCHLIDGTPAVRTGAPARYEEWSGWIDPDLDAAAAALRRVITDYDEAVARAAIGRRRLEATTSPAAVRRAFMAALEVERVPLPNPPVAE